MQSNDDQQKADEELGNEIRYFVIVGLVGYAIICMVLAVYNYTQMWMIIQYVKYCNAKKGTVENELFLKVYSLYAVFRPMEFNSEFDTFIVEQLNSYFHEQIRKAYLFNKDPADIIWQRHSMKLLGYIFYKYAGVRVFNKDCSY